MKKIVIPSAIVLLVLSILCFVPIQWNVSQTMTVQVTEDMSEGSFIETEMKIAGKYSFYFFQPDCFDGKIEIASFPETAEKNVDFKVTGTSPSSLIYHSWSGSELNSVSFGLIKANFGMKQMIIFKSDENGGINLDGEQTCVILADDSTLEEARKLLNAWYQAED